MRNENEFESGFAALKSEVARPGAAQDAKKVGAVAPRRVPLTLVGLPVAVIAAMALMIAIPRPSAAAELNAVMDALKKAGTWMAIVYETDKSGHERMTQKIASNGTVYKTTYLEGGSVTGSGSEDALAFAEGKRYNFFPKYTYIDDAGEEKKVGPEQQIEDMLRNDLVTGVRVERNVLLEGQKRDKYLMSWNQKVAQGRSGEIAIYTEIGTKRPVKMIGVLGNSIGFHTEWRYKDVPADLLTLTTAPGKPVYDTVVQREALKQLVKSAPQTSGVHALGAWADTTGVVMILTTGDAGIPFTAVEGFQIAGLPKGERTYTQYNDQREAGNNQWYVPRVAFGVDTIAHFTLFKDTAIPDEITVTMPVWTELGNYEPKTVTVTLPVTKTFSVLNIVMPNNAYFFDAPK